MELRRAVDALCRCHSTASISSLASRSGAFSHSASQLRQYHVSRQASRGFSSNTRLQQQSQARKHERDSAPPPGKARNQANDSTENHKSRGTTMNRLLDGTMPPSSASYEVRPRIRTAEANGSGISAQTPSTSSFDDLSRELFGASRGLPDSTGLSSQRSPYSSGLLNLASPDPFAKKDLARPRVIEELDFNLRPRIGRMINVERNSPNDLGKKLRTLDILVARNRIKYEFNVQRFHERPGLKRKRLASKRWRTSFKAKFTGAINRVNDLRAQGW